MKLTSPDHISSIYQLMFLIFKVNYYHCSFQNISLSLMKKSKAVDRRFSVKKDSMMGAFLLVFLFFKSSYRPASDMACFTEIYLRLEKQHKWSIRYLVICHLCKCRLISHIIGMYWFSKSNWHSSSNLKSSILKYRKWVCFPDLYYWQI